MLSLISSRQIPKHIVIEIPTKHSALCAGCESVKICRITKVFKNVSSLKKHLVGCGSFDIVEGDRPRPPPKEEIIKAINDAQTKFGKDVSFELIPEFHEWKVLIL